MFAFQLQEETLDLAQALNNGVRPELENEDTYFVYKGEDEVPMIVTSEDFWTTFEIYWKDFGMRFYLKK